MGEIDARSASQTIDQIQKHMITSGFSEQEIADGYLLAIQTLKDRDEIMSNF